jgi:hypothetical protein
MWWYPNYYNHQRQKPNCRRYKCANRHIARQSFVNVKRIDVVDRGVAKPPKLGNRQRVQGGYKRCLGLSVDPAVKVLSVVVLNVTS